MSAPDPLAKVRKTRFITREIVLWSTAALFAAGYLLTLGLAPDLLEDLTPASIATPQSNDGQRAAARLAGDVKALRDSVAQVQLDLAKVKTEVSSFTESQKVLSQQVATFARQPSEPAAQIQAQAEAPAAAPVAPPKSAPPASAKTEAAPLAQPPAAIEAALPPNTSVQPKVINATEKEQMLSLETGSVDKKATANASAVDFGPAVVRKAPKPVGVQISSGASVDSLRLSWSLLADRHADTLKNLEARYQDKGDAANPAFDLVAGPLKSKADAQRVCKALAAKNVPCKISDFEGDTL